MKPLLSTLSLLFLPLLFSCSSPSGVNIKPESSHWMTSAAGAKKFNGFKEKWPVVNHPQVAQVSAQLTQVLPSLNHGWEVVTFQRSAPNAFALPGGKIGVHTGILTHAHNDAQLATIIAHEAAHIIKNHHHDHGKRKRVLEALQSLPQGTAQEAALKERVSNNILPRLPDVTALEIEADQVGLIYMAKAGYDPREAIKFWENFSAYKKRYRLNKGAYLTTHPLDSRRIDKLNETLPRALREYYKSPYRKKYDYN